MPYFARERRSRARRAPARPSPRRRRSPSARSCRPRPTGWPVSGWVTAAGGHALFPQRQLGLGGAAFLHSSMKAASAGLPAAACAASGCSGATAQKVTPMMVSARVVNTYMRPSPISCRPSASRMSWVKAKRTPSLLPIQFSCISLTRSGQPGRWPFATLSSSSWGVVGDLQVVAGISRFPPARRCASPCRR